ncbi:MAG: outer membrane beta-barrel protein [Flavobacteriales bacterium]|nr:outer membrane beta-barrel protein [Flavobacteriales bacterium]
MLINMLLVGNIHAQSPEITISGYILEKDNQLPVSGAVVMLCTPDSLQMIHGVQSDSTGHYSMQTKAQGQYKLLTLMSGFAPDTAFILLSQEHIKHDVQLHVSAAFLNEVTISETIARMEIRGDTVQFNAAAFQVNPDATAEDLVKKMPGISVDGNTVKSNGEEIKKVIVDGKPFFGDDPTTTLKTLPADMIESVQVYDQQSDQADFGGYKDGNAEKTINIKTKKDRKNGNFGRVYAGVGTDEKYQAGFAVNNFENVRRIALLGMSNNINMQNFSPQDLSGSGGGGQGGKQMGGRGMNFAVPNQNGITTTHAGGLNYSDEWGKKITISSSYFYNQSENNNQTNTIRNYFSDDGQRYEENYLSSANNINHRGHLKLEYRPDTVNKINWNFRLTSQDNQQASSTTGRTSFWPHDSTAIALHNQNSTTSDAINMVSNVVYQHRFKKARRTTSLDINAQLNKRNIHGDYQAISTYYINQDSLVELHQAYHSITKTMSLSPILSYTEPLGDSSMLIMLFKPSWQINTTSRLTDDLVLDIEDYAALSNKYSYQYNKTAGGIAYNYFTSKQEFTAGFDAEQSQLAGLQTFPVSDTTDRTFFNILPRINYVRKFVSKASLSVNATSTTQSPSVNQLQDVLDVSNPLFVRSGNASLVQSRDNTIDIRFNKRIPESEIHYMISIGGSYVQNFIGGVTNILSSDTTLQGVNIARGAQLSTYANMDHYYTARFHGSYGFPVTKLKVNINLTASYSYSQTPAMMNNLLYYTGNNSASGGVSMSSNISKDIDFMLSGNTTYNKVENGLNVRSNNTYTTQTLTAKLNWIFLDALVLSSDINMNYYLGLSQSNRQQFALWNAGLGYKFGQSKSFELKVSCYDILKQNVSLNRTVNATFTEDTRSQSLQRYGMLSMTYTFKKFKEKKQTN